MRPSFKDYLLLSQVEHLPEQALNEIFGKFFGKAPPASRAERLSALKRKEAEFQQKVGQLRTRKDLEWERVKRQIDQEEARKLMNRLGHKRVGASVIRPTGTTSAQAQGRAAEIEWLKFLTSEK